MAERYAVYERRTRTSKWTFVVAVTDARAAETARLDVVDRYEAQLELRDTMIIEGSAVEVRRLPPVLEETALHRLRVLWTRFPARPLTQPLPWNGELP